MSSLVPFHALTRSAFSLTSLQSESFEERERLTAVFLPRTKLEDRTAAKQPAHNPESLINNANIEQLFFPTSMWTLLCH